MKNHETLFNRIYMEFIAAFSYWRTPKTQMPWLRCAPCNVRHAYAFVKALSHWEELHKGMLTYVIWANTMRYAETGYWHVRHKLYSLRACWHMLSYGTTHNGHERFLCIFKMSSIWHHVCCTLGLCYNVLCIRSIHSMYVRCTLDMCWNTFY